MIQAHLQREITFFLFYRIWYTSPHRCQYVWANSQTTSLVSAFYILRWFIHMSMVSCQKGPTRHAYAWQIGLFGRIPSIWYTCALIATMPQKCKRSREPVYVRYIQYRQNIVWYLHSMSHSFLIYINDSSFVCNNCTPINSLLAGLWFTFVTTRLLFDLTLLLQIAVNAMPVLQNGHDIFIFLI